MIGIRATSIAQTIRTLKEVRQKIGKDADARFRQKILYAFELVVKVSPQFSGDFASNWHIVTSDIPAYRRWPGKVGVDRSGKMLPIGTVHRAGDPEAVSFAMARAKFELQGVTRNSRVSFVNVTDLDTDGTHMTGPDGTVELRPENVIPGRVRIESYLRARLKEVNASAVAKGYA